MILLLGIGESEFVTSGRHNSLPGTASAFSPLQCFESAVLWGWIHLSTGPQQSLSRACIQSTQGCSHSAQWPAHLLRTSEPGRAALNSLISAEFHVLIFFTHNLISCKAPRRAGFGRSRHCPATVTDLTPKARQQQKRP